MNTKEEQAQKDTNCTVELLAIASQACYRLKEENTINPDIPRYAQTLDDIGKHGYELAAGSIAPTESGGTGTSPLAALCLEPKKNHSGPIIIAFRGTQTGRDFAADLDLSLTGSVGKEFRDDAYKFYQEVSKRHPDKEIIITGHSLGGHLAQYVAAKAYNTTPRLVAKPSLLVRTFNTASINTSHGAVFERNPDLKYQFVHYRLSSDLISQAPLQNVYGNSFDFFSKKWAWAAHSMDPVRKGLSEDILKQHVGTRADSSKKQNALIEMTNGLLHSYKCYVKDQYFSKWRAGAGNLKLMKTILPDALEKIKAGDYDDAIEQLMNLKEGLKKQGGKMSINMVDVLISSTLNVKLSHQMEKALQSEQVAKPLKEEAQVSSNIAGNIAGNIAAQQKMKAGLNSLKENSKETLSQKGEAMESDRNEYQNQSSLTR